MLQAISQFDPRAWLRRCDLNLAPLRYERVLRRDGGPIEHLERMTVAVREGPLHNVNAFLAEGLKPMKGEATDFYSNADGGGTHALELVARFKAISEAIERWAFWDRVESAGRDLFGFDIEPSTTGMAAFPGLLQERARHTARLEALERFALLHWWEGRLPHRLERGVEGMQVVEILLPTREACAVIVFEDDVALGTRHYGYGAGDDYGNAVARAHGEMIRHRLTVGRFVRRFPDPAMGLVTLRHGDERRSFYFALREGRQLFDDRLAEGPWGAPARLRQVFDGWIPGAWNRYATVWRCLFEPPSDDHLGDRGDYFFW
ncbi:MAG: hypothetical protein ACLFR7_08640 [Opitutales bacterium]